MEQYIELIKTIIPGFTEDRISPTFDNAGIESMDLLTIRVEFENISGGEFSDNDWLSFTSLADIIAFCQVAEKKGNAGDEHSDSISGARKIRINMPQMAIGALSENWLFKEIGDTHWDMLCAGLNTPSLQLKDENDNRLYATFVRIRITSSIALNEYTENEELKLESTIMRFGNGMYFSDIALTGENGKIEANLMTSFSIRNDTDNTKLMKSQPAAKPTAIAEYGESPAFGNEYRLIKKGFTTDLVLAETVFSIGDKSIYTTTYTLNPYYDLNGVGLLYFAAYPIINNACEARFFNDLESVDTRWELSYHTIARDVLYFANCNINDDIRYVLNDYEFIGRDKVKISSTLYREADNAIMARIFTIKKKIK